MEGTPSKTDFIDRVRESRRKLDAVIGTLRPFELTFPGASGDWSVKDILAHITWHDREMFNLVFERKLAGSEWWDLPLDERNQKIFEQNQNLELDDVLDDAKSVFEGLLEVLLTLSAEDLMEPRRFTDMPHDWLPWELIADNTYLHYEDHLADLEKWQNKTERG